MSTEPTAATKPCAPSPPSRREASRALTDLDTKYRQGWDDGYDAGYATARADALEDPMTFCTCSASRCAGVESVADGTAESCWLCTFLDGEAPCPAYVDEYELEGRSE